MQSNGKNRFPESSDSRRRRNPSRFWPLLPAALFALAVSPAPAPLWDEIPPPTSSDLRGVSALSDGVAWASGTKGTFLRTSDEGRSWAAAVVPGAEALDFRDVEAFDGRSAVLMSAGPGSASRIYRTGDGGARWDLALENPDHPKGFFDAIAFWDRQNGLALGDPVDGRFVLFATEDGGAHWMRVPREGVPPALAGEGAFAASGTCLAVGAGGRAWFGTGGGGETGRIFRSEDRGRTWRVSSSGIPAATASSGVFSVAFWSALDGIAVGGDYKVPRGAAPSIALTKDGGATWTTVTMGPGVLNHYYSAAAIVPGTTPPVLVVAGPADTSWSSDGGRTWNTPSAEVSYNAVAFSSPLFGWAVGPAGHLGRFSRRVSEAWTGGARVAPSPAPKGGTSR